MNLKGKKILVTGGAGFIGSHLVDRLVALRAKVVVLDDLSNGKLSNLKESINKIKFIKGDIRDETALEAALDGVKAIAHQAAWRSVPDSINRPWEYNEVNVNGTLKLFIRAKHSGIKKIICASSSSVYGERDTFPEKESEEAKPISPYAATKLIVEQYSHVFSRLYNMEIINLRYFNVYGPRQSLDDEYAVVIPKFISCLLNKKSPPIYGDGDQERDFTFIDNVVDMNIQCFEKDNIGSEVFNVGLGIPNSVNNLFKNLKEIMKSDIKPVYCPSRLGDVRKTQADMEKAKKLLGFSSKVDFFQGLKETVEWFRGVN
ncbi:MAG: SDR family NAD(P)-dependent oxidoreductase [Candidatus Omnitrophota bacterium]